MGHRQLMTDKQRNEWDAMQYRARLEARRGSQRNYLSEEKRDQLISNGYKYYIFENGKKETNFAFHAKDMVMKLRESGHYARVVVDSSPNIKGTQTYCILYKQRI